MSWDTLGFVISAPHVQAGEGRRVGRDVYVGSAGLALDTASTTRPVVFVGVGPDAWLCGGLADGQRRQDPAPPSVVANQIPLVRGILIQGGNSAAAQTISARLVFGGDRSDTNLMSHVGSVASIGRSRRSHYLYNSIVPLGTPKRMMMQ